VKNRAKIKPALFQVAAALVIVNECVNLRIRPSLHSHAAQEHSMHAVAGMEK
jgi:hypothetical protein